jgi:hypothetical protein
MAFVLVFAAVLSGLLAAGFALASGAGFLVIIGAYIGAGSFGMLCAALLVLRLNAHRAALPGWEVASR